MGQGLSIVGHGTNEAMSITLTPTLSLRELTGVGKCAVSYECQSTSPLSPQGERVGVRVKSTNAYPCQP